MLTCGACGQASPEGFRFCGACGAALQPAVNGAREERKVVTALFADLVGFTARSESMDPEDVRALLRTYHEQVAADLRRHGGTVEKFIGDAVMALFGAPVAHEDDPERAVRAALAIRDWAVDQPDLQVRIGINTGEALVSLQARPDEGEGMAAGDVINVAARLQAGAPPNAILVGEATRHATDTAIEYREVPPIDAKGKASPVSVWQAVQARSRLGVDVLQHTRTRLVGREREVALLQSSFERAEAERTPQLITLVGVPGMGKSRLVSELLAVVEALPYLVVWRQGRSLPYGSGVAYWAVAEMVKAQAGIVENDDATAASEKLRSAVTAVIADSAEARQVIGHLGPLIGLDSSGESSERRDEAHAAWRRFFEALAERNPVVLVFEDLHWADEGLLDFVDSLAEWLSDVPMLVLGTARPELLERRPDWGGGKANATTLRLGPLSDEETTELLAALSQRRLMSAETQHALLAQAGGNPLYAEQYVRMVEERGGLEVVPESLQAILAARVDALSADEKRLVQDAAVMGKVFWLGFVSSADEIGAAGVTRLLHGLERKEFVRRERRTSVAGETQYAFHHALLRDAAYGQIPRAARAETHRRAARWLEALSADRVEDRADLLAHHYLQAVEYSRASHGDVSRFADRAREAFMVAGGRALWLGAFDAADGFYRAAADLTPPGHRRDPEIQYRLALREMLVEGTGGDRLLAAVERLRQGEDLQLAAQVASSAAQAFWYRTDRRTAYRLADLAIELTAALPPSPAKAEALMRRASFHMLNWQPEPALGRAREALAMAESLGLEHVRARTLNIIGVTRVGMGDPGGLADGQAAVAIAREIRNLDILMSSLENLRSSQWYLGLIEEAAASVADMQATSGAHRGLTRQLTATMDASLAYTQGDWQRALRSAEIAAAVESADETTYWIPWVLAVRVAIHLARGEMGPAPPLAKRALARGRAAEDPQVLIPGLWASGATLLAAGRLDEARALAREVFATTANLILAWDLGVEFAWLCTDLGLSGELEASIADQPDLPWNRVMRVICAGDYLSAAAMLVDLRHRPGEAQARLRAAEALAAAGRRAESAIELERALDFYRSVGASAEIARAERLLAA